MFLFFKKFLIAFLLFLFNLNFFASEKISQTQQKLNHTKDIIKQKKKEKQIYIDKQKEIQEDLKKIEQEIESINHEKKDIEKKIHQTKITISALETNLKLLASDVDFYSMILTAEIKNYIERYYLIRKFFEDNFDRRLKKDIFKGFVKQIIKIKETLNYTEDLKREYEKEKEKLNFLNYKLDEKKRQQLSLYKKKGELLMKLTAKQKQLDKEIAELNNTQKELEILLKKLYKEEKERKAKLQKIQVPERKIVRIEKKFMKPLEGAVICKFGKTQLEKDGYCVLRNGIIIQGMSNSDVLCVDDGKVLFISNNFRSYGKIVIVEHKDEIHTVYGNLGKILVSEGNTIRKSAPVGKTDSSGQLYFEIRKNLIPVDPELYLE